MRSLKALAYVVLVLGLALGMCEVTLRFLYREPWYQQLLNEQLGGSSTAAVQHNSMGLRDRDYSPTKPDGTRRVLFLGDSFTYGSGVADDAAIFPELIEARLNAEGGLPAVESVEVLNGAIAGSYPSHWYELLQSLLEPFAPDAIVVVFFLRDGTQLQSINHFFGPIRDTIVARNAASPLYRYSYIYRVLRDARDRQFVAEDYTRELHAGYFGRGERSQHWRNQQEDLQLIFGTARERGIPVLFVVFPVLAGLDEEPYPFERITRLLERFARQHDVPVHDLLEDFRGLDGPDLWVSAYDQHPNESAHAIVAEALLPFVREMIGEARSPAPKRQ